MDVTQRILGIILPVFIIVMAGFVYARLRGEIVKSHLFSVNRLCVELLSPLLLFSALAAKEFDLSANLPLMLAGVLIALGSACIAWPIARLFGYDVRTFVPPMMYNNCGNMGLPLAVLAFGSAGLSQAVALFVACSLVYFTVGVRLLESGRAEGRRSHWSMFATPMMAAMLGGIVFAACRWTLPDTLLQALRMIGEASIPLMLIALGVRMTDMNLRSWRIGLLGAALCPLAGLVMAMMIDPLISLTPVQRGQMYLFAALPPAVFTFMVAETYKQEPEKVAAIVMLGNLASLVFVPLGLWMGL